MCEGKVNTINGRKLTSYYINKKEQSAKEKKQPEFSKTKI